MIALRDGMHVESKGIIDEMGSQDVIIKGANAIDPQGVAGVMQGTSAWWYVGRHKPCYPVGLEKSIHIL